MNFDLGKRHILGAIVLGIIVGILQVHCDSGKPSQEAEAEAEEAAYTPTPDERLAQLAASGAVHGAHERGLSRAIRDLHRKLHAKKKDRQAQMPSAEETDVLTFLFSANIHGEREDCGCKSNPLGGLTRRQTLIELARDSSSAEAARWWGDELPASDATFEVDAGDLMFKNTSLDRHPERLQKKAEGEARALADALAVNPPDVANVGEIDLALGLQTYKELAERAKLPVVSANLFEAGGQRPFEGHRIVERDGRKVAFIGLLKEKSRIADYYKSRKLEVKQAAPAYRAELGELPDDVALVVMLSNLGTRRTGELVEELRAEGARVDAAIVSNTNRLTRTPQWAGGVPIVEPLSRGKYFGRLDLLLGDKSGTHYANAVVDPRETVQNYRRAWGAYAGARDERRKAAREIAQLEKRLQEHRERARKSDDKAAPSSEEAAAKEATDEKGEAEKGKAEKFVEATSEETKSRIEFLRKKLETLDRRVESTSKIVAARSAGLGSFDELGKQGDGDDWAMVRIVQVKLDIPEQQQVRKALDRH